MNESVTSNIFDINFPFKNYDEFNSPLLLKCKYCT